MKKYILLILFIFVNLIYAKNKANDIEGFWIMPDKPKGRMKVVRIIEKNNNIYAYAVELHKDVKSTLDIYNPNKKLRDKELKGLIFIYDIKFEDGEWKMGRIYHTDQGSIFYAKISLLEDKNTLYLRASLDKAGKIGATVEWKRLSEESYKYNDIQINKLRTIEGKSI